MHKSFNFFLILFVFDAFVIMILFSSRFWLTQHKNNFIYVLQSLWTLQDLILSCGVLWILYEQHKERQFHSCSIYGSTYSPLDIIVRRDIMEKGKIQVVKRKLSQIKNLKTQQRKTSFYVSHIVPVDLDLHKLKNKFPCICSYLSLKMKTLWYAFSSLL